MRSGFGRWVLEHRGARIGLIAGLMTLPIMGVLSAAIVVAVSMAKGWRDAVLDCGVAMVVLAVVTLIAGGIWTQMLFSAVTTWGAAILFGALTAAYGSLTLTLQAMLVLVLLGLTTFVVVVGDPIAFWERVLREFAEQMSAVGVEFTEPAALLELAPVMSGLVAVSVVTSSMLALLIGAWWASAAGGPPFRNMFVNIRLGYVLGGVAVLAGIAALFVPGHLAGNALLVIGGGFVFQGLAVLHWLVAAKGLSWMFLIPVYLPFFMGASVTVVALFLLATVGFIDNWYGLRRVRTDVR